MKYCQLQYMIKILLLNGLFVLFSHAMEQGVVTNICLTSNFMQNQCPLNILLVEKKRVGKKRKTLEEYTIKNYKKAKQPRMRKKEIEILQASLVDNLFKYIKMDEAVIEYIRHRNKVLETKNTKLQKQCSDLQKVLETKNTKLQKQCSDLQNQYYALKEKYLKVFCIEFKKQNAKLFSHSDY